MKKIDIGIQNLSKIEGHADLDVKVRNGQVKEVHIKFTDSKRFFTQAIRDREIATLPQSVARICGTCSIAHTLCCIEAIEKALGITPTKQTRLLKQLTMNGLMIRDHALHVYLFSLPDVLEKDSVLDFKGKEVQFLKDSFDVKRAGNKLDTIVAGRAVHAPFPAVGGFASIPDNKELREVVKELQKARKKLIPLMEVYYKSKIDYTRKTHFVALGGKTFDFLGDHIVSSTGMHIAEEELGKHLQRVILPYSQATGYKFKEETFLVGALARINLNKKNLHPNTKQDAKKYLKAFPSNNVFHNNLAQVIEIMHAIDSSIDIIKTTKFVPEEPIKAEYKDCEGIGVIEAPRGTLLYRLDLNSNGKVNTGDIVTPTQQNQINIELDVKELVQNTLGKLTKEQIQYELEKLIRSYDPCISCATHFLKVNWV